MSFARWSADSDVYVYSHVDGFVECCGCLLGDEWELHSASDVVAHMREHVAASHKVPEYLLDESLYEDSDFVPYERRAPLRS